jgi:hypothetical protein
MNAEQFFDTQEFAASKTPKEKRRFTYWDVIKFAEIYNSERFKQQIPTEKKIYSVEDLLKIANPNKWVQMYREYSDMLTNEDVASFWQEQYDIANKERNELKEQLKTK